MKFSAKHSIEPLEARIAPARTIIAGVPNGSLGVNDVDYTDVYAPKLGTTEQDPIQRAIDDAVFLDTVVEAINGDNKIAGKVSLATDPQNLTFYLRMSAGDILKVYNAQSGISDPYLTVTKGNIIAFFVDKDGDNEVDEDELTGISMGKNAKIVLKSGVAGDIVTNLNEFGTRTTADDELDMSGLISDKQAIGGIQVLGGRIDGSIISGGNISNVVVNGTVGAILAGTAANNKAFDFFPDVAASQGRPAIAIPGGDGLLSVPAAPGKIGASITNVFVDGLGTPGALGVTLNGSLNGVLQAGGGGDGAKGGAVTFVRITEDADGLTILGGAGGDSGTKRNGGAGGAVTRIYIGGFPDVNDSVDTVVVQGGAGGDSTNGRGGNGGILKDIFVGYQFFGTKPVATDNLLNDRIQVLGGEGGDGKIGGSGGSITLADIRVETPDGTDPGAPADEIAVIGGNGGGSILGGGRAGAGGNLLNITIRNQDLAAGFAYADTLIRGGNAGIADSASLGAAGGNVTNVTLLSWELKVQGGNGSEGKRGGNGGSLTNIDVIESDEILTIGAQFDAGFGGSGSAGNGGRGGNINGINFTDSDLASLAINSGDAANGGAATGGRGGAGGTVMNVDVRDNNVSNGATFTPLNNPAKVRTGDGGDGTKGGGAGGAMRNLSIDSTNMNVEVGTGKGGDVDSLIPASLKGKGGAGGSLDLVSVTVRGLAEGELTTAQATAGAGGFGSGNLGAGGAGGGFRFVNVSAAGEGFLRAGNGGDGQETDGATRGGASGRGGSIFASQLTAQGGDGELTAGHAGVKGAKAGVGGSIAGQSADIRSGLFAQNNITIRAGDGSHGGAGGSIKFVGFGSGVIALSPTPRGNIVIQAGHGSADGRLAGAGGSIQDVGGSLPSFDITQPNTIFTTTVNAGNGGGSDLRSAAGGFISDLVILGGGHAGTVFTVQAGDAGDSANAAVGAKGGDVKNVTVSSVDLGTIFRSVAAGDGGDAFRKGGAGGSVLGVSVDRIDIGDRRDVPFGFTQMGGVFAGKAGSTLSKPLDSQRDGINGKVIDIVAKGIASIVAGRDLIPEAVEFVDKITLDGSNTLLVQTPNVFVPPGSFRLSYDAAATAVETTPGDAVAQEVQTLTLGALVSGAAQIVYTFGVDSTLPLAGDATEAEIQAALNQLPSIQATGPNDTGSVTVTAVTDANNVIVGYDITFDQTGDKAGLISLAATAETAVLPQSAPAVDVETALNALPTIQFLGANNVGGSTTVEARVGSYYVTFTEGGNQIQLEGIEVFDSNVTTPTGGALVDTVATETIAGSVALDVTELQTGGAVLPVGEFVAGNDTSPETQIFTVDAFATVPGAQVQFGFTAEAPLVEATPGDILTREVQTIDLTAVRGDARSSFTLTFNGETTPPLPSTASAADVQTALNKLATVGAQVGGAGGVSVQWPGTNILQVTFVQFGVRPEMTVAVSSTTPLISAELPEPPAPAPNAETEFEAAINNMASIKFTAPDRLTGTADVQSNAVNSYFVVFSADGDQQNLSVTAFANEHQELSSQLLVADPLADFTLSFSRDYTAVEFTRGATGTPLTRERQDIVLGPVLGAGADTTFTISYNGRTTAALPSTATAAQIQGAINALAIGGVTVALDQPTGTIRITFVANGDNPNLFTAQAVSRTAPLAADAADIDIQNALNALPTVQGPVVGSPETVTVSRQVDLDIEVTFDTLGQRNLITADLLTPEGQQVDVTSLLFEATGSFRLGFEGEYTLELPPSATAAEVETALNALTTIQAIGGVTVTSNAAGFYDVRFAADGPQSELDVQLEVDEIQNVDFTPGKPLDLTIVNNVLAVEQLAGSPGVQEIQTLTLGDVLSGASTAQFTLTYDDGVNPAQTTAVLPGTATDAEILAALESLPAIGAGGVTVQILPGGVIEVTFTVADVQTGLLSARATESTQVAAAATAAEIETALNQLTTVKASGVNGTGGSVSVVLGTGSDMTVRFNSGGNQPLIVATQEAPLNVVTTREGNTVFNEIQAFAASPKGQVIDAAYAIANLIGFFSDHSEFGANIFHFVHDGMVTDATVRDFVPGDQPIDGLLFAKKANLSGLNVVPEAYRIGGTFYDWNNII